MRFHTRHRADYIYVHINKTGGSRIEQALGLPFQHRTAAEIRDDIGPARWHRRFSFAFVRNPWDKVCSRYHFRVRTNQTGLRESPISFEEWVMQAYGEHDPRYYDKPKMFMPRVQRISDSQGKQLVDLIGRFGCLEDDFAHVCQILQRRVELPHVKRSGVWTSEPSTRRVRWRSSANDSPRTSIASATSSNEIAF